MVFCTGVCPYKIMFLREELSCSFANRTMDAGDKFSLNPAHELDFQFATVLHNCKTLKLFMLHLFLVLWC